MQPQTGETQELPDYSPAEWYALLAIADEAVAREENTRRVVWLAILIAALTGALGLLTFNPYVLTLAVGLTIAAAALILASGLG